MSHFVHTPRIRISSATVLRHLGRNNRERALDVVAGVSTLAILLVHDGCAPCAFPLRSSPLCSPALSGVRRLALLVALSPLFRKKAPVCRGWWCRRPSPHRPRLGCPDSSLALLQRPRLSGRRPRRRRGLGASPCEEALVRLVGQVRLAVVELQTPAPERAGSHRSCCGCPGSSR